MPTGPGLIHAIVDRRVELRGGEIVQVRAKLLSARDLLGLAEWYAGRGHTVIVNTRTDVAIAAGAHGVHLPAGSFDPRRLRDVVPAGFAIGISCHSRADLLAAESAGVDYAYLSPVFRPLSKPDTRTPLGLDGFAEAVAGIRIPVLALGGVRREDWPACQAAGAAGIAGISLAREEFLPPA